MNYWIVCFIISILLTFSHAKPIEEANCSSPATDPCPRKHPDCYQAPQHADHRMQLMQIGVWIVGPKKGQPIYDLDELQRQKELLAEMRKQS